jgi:hypothetical protein
MRINTTLQGIAFGSDKILRYASPDVVDNMLASMMHFLACYGCNTNSDPTSSLK